MVNQGQILIPCHLEVTKALFLMIDEANFIGHYGPFTKENLYMKIAVKAYFAVQLN